MSVFPKCPHSSSSEVRSRFVGQVYLYLQKKLASSDLDVVPCNLFMNMGTVRRELVQKCLDSFLTRCSGNFHVQLFRAEYPTSIQFLRRLKVIPKSLRRTLSLGGLLHVG